MAFQNKIRKSSNSVCGLVFHHKSDDNEPISHDETIPVPLKNVQIDAKIVDFISEIKVTQSYVNVEPNPIEATYMFPIEEEAAVISFEAEVEDREIITEIREKQEARHDYDKAIDSSKTALLLEETTPDLFQIKLGHLKTNKEARITITYVCELPVEDGKIKLTVPTTIAPRYVPSSDDSEAAKQIASISYSSSAPATLSFSFTGLAQYEVKSIKSPSHQFTITIDKFVHKNGHFTYSGELSNKASDLDRDIILYIESHKPDQQNKATIFLEKPDDERSHNGIVGMLSLVPYFELDDHLTEMIFLVDRSGSMRGCNMNQVKKALELFLHSLPSNCYFNIWSFGSRYDALFVNGSREYSDSSLRDALEHVRQMSANYGETDIHSPLKYIFDQAKPSPYHMRQVFVLTDGRVSNVPTIISLVKENKTQGRVFSLGIGSSTSRHLVKGIARAGNGSSVFANENEDLRVKVMNQLKDALQPAISNITIKWGDELSDLDATFSDRKGIKNDSFVHTKSQIIQGSEVDKNTSKLNWMTKQVPSNIQPIFDGTRLLAYHFYSPDDVIPTKINIKADSPKGQLSIDVSVDEGNVLQENKIIRKLAARKKIQELEESNNFDLLVETLNDNFDVIDEKEEIKKTIVELGIENNLTSQFTSFVGIDQTTGDTIGDKLMYTRRIDNQVPSGFGGTIFYSGIIRRSRDSSGNSRNKNENESNKVEQLSTSERRYRRMRDLNNVASQKCRNRRKRTSLQSRTSGSQRFSRPHSSSGKKN